MKTEAITVRADKATGRSVEEGVMTESDQVSVTCDECGGSPENIQGCEACCRDCGRPCTFDKDAEGFHVERVDERNTWRRAAWRNPSTTSAS